MLTPKQKAVLEFIEQSSRQNGYAPSQHEIAKHFGFKSLGTVQNYLVRLERHGLLKKPWNAKRGMAVLRDSKKLFGSTEGLLDSSTTTPPSRDPWGNQVESLIPALDTLASKRSLEAVPPPSPVIPLTGRVPSVKPTAVPAAEAIVSASAAVVSLPLLGRVAAGLPIEYAEYDQTVDIPLSLFSRPVSTSHRQDLAENHYVLRVKGDSMIGDGILDGDYVVIEKQSHAEQGQTVVAMIGTEATIKRFYRRKGQIELRAANPNYEPIFVDSLTETRDFRIEGVLVGLIRKL
jgi:SOS regulatory protein LexA